MQHNKTTLKQRCFWFSVNIIKFVGTFGNKPIEQIIARQLLRAATSIGANVIEAIGSPSKKDFKNYFNIALKSSKETIYWLYLCKESKIGDNQQLSILIQECTEISKMLAASILTMEGKR